MSTDSNKVYGYYKSVLDAADKVREASTSSTAGSYPALAKNHAFVTDFEKVVSVLASRPEAPMLAAACREYQFGLVAVAFGLYRPAYASLRLSLELSLGAIRFSGQEVSFRNWLLDKKDLSWAEITDLDNGIYSAPFVRAFEPTYDPLRLAQRELAVSLYRECSEFVHGNASSNQALPATITYSAATADAWHSRSADFRRVLLFAVSLRYARDLPASAREILAPITIDQLGNIEAVRQTFQDSPGGK